MEKFSLLKRNTSAIQSSLHRHPRPPTNSLYKLLESVSDGNIKGLTLRAIDGQQERDYTVEKYERYKAGLLGRVWLKRRNDTTARLIEDKEALGLEWELSE